MAYPRVVASGNRKVSALQDAGFLPSTLFYDRVIPTGANPAIRQARREDWFEGLQNALKNCDLLFLDPDNGLEPASFKSGSVAAGKCVGLAELARLSQPGPAALPFTVSTTGCFVSLRCCMIHVCHSGKAGVSDLRVERRIQEVRSEHLPSPIRSS